jgi:hypothetical protein
MNEANTGPAPTETTQGALSKIITLTVGNEKTRSVLLSLLTVASALWATGYEVGFWGLMDGPIERLNREKTPQYFGVDPDVREVLIDTERDLFECRVYNTGDAVAIRRTLRPDNTVYQQYRWLTPEPPDKTTRAIYRRLILETAYAADDPAPGKLKPDWKDKLLDRLSDCVAKVQRIYPDGCWKIIVVDMCTGAIVETITAGCP